MTEDQPESMRKDLRRVGLVVLFFIAVSVLLTWAWQRELGSKDRGNPRLTPLGWDVIGAYEYQPGLVGLPETIENLDGKRVTLRGFLRSENGGFYLTAKARNSMFDDSPEYSEMVRVQFAHGPYALQQLPHPPARVIPTDAVLVTGTLRIGEVKQWGIVFAIYSLENAKARLAGPQGR